MYDPHYEEESRGSGFLIGLLCGTALGAAIGLLFAPKAGSEIRQRLYDSTDDIRRKATETYDQASEQMNTWCRRVDRPWIGAARPSIAPGSQLQARPPVTAAPPTSAARIDRVSRTSTQAHGQPAAPKP